MSEANSFHDDDEPHPTVGCPAPSVWGDVVAGVIEGDLARRYLDHAAQCAACGRELGFARHAIEGGTDRQGESRKDLLTASEAWQKKFAESIAAGEMSETNDKVDRKPK